MKASASPQTLAIKLGHCRRTLSLASLASIRYTQASRWLIARLFQCHGRALPCRSFTRHRQCRQRSGFQMVTPTRTWLAGHVGRSLRRASQRRRSKRCTDCRPFQLRSDVRHAALPSEYRNSFLSFALPSSPVCSVSISVRCTVGILARLPPLCTARA
jgi:hypothetical protein